MNGCDLHFGLCSSHLLFLYPRHQRQLNSICEHRTQKLEQYETTHTCCDMSGKPELLSQPSRDVAHSRGSLSRWPMPSKLV